MSAHATTLLLLVLLVAAADCLRADTLLKSGDSLQSGRCSAGSYEYCCYDKKCSGEGKYVNKTIKCDQKSHSCITNSTTGYPSCVKDEDGGLWTLCQILTDSIWYTCGCTYDRWGKVSDCACWLGALFYVIVVIGVVSIVLGLVLRTCRYYRTLRGVERPA